MENRYPPRWLTVHFPHTSTAILKIDVMKRHFEYRPFLGAGLKGTTEGEPLLHCITFVVVFVFVY